MLKRVLLLAVTLLSITVYGQINTGSPTIPFGSNTSYEYGIMPTNLTATGIYGQSTDVGSAYNTWKSTYVENCGTNMARVRFDDPSTTVSEGIAYGMLIAVYAADQDLFNRLWAFYKNNTNQNGVMNWKIQGCSNGTPGQNGATDAELDAAMALIVASKQWPNTTSPHNYVNDGKALINAIKDWEVSTSDGTYYNGDLWHPDCRNPSYQAPAYSRAYKLFMSENGTNQDSFWDNVASGTENLFENNAHSSSGLSTNWCLPSGIPNSSCSGSGTAPDKFGYDACRAPWRQGVDILWWGTTETGDVQDVINRQAAFWTSKGGATTVQGSNNMNWDGSGSGDHNGAFTGMVGAMSLGASSTHQSLCNDLYTENLKSSMDNGYFTGILRILGLFVQTGNFWNPYAEPDDSENDAPIVFISAPTDNTSICLGEAVTITASASDNGSVSKVEFYSGNTLLFTESTAPYSRSWEFITSGTKTIKAIAYDDEGQATTSITIEIEVNTVPNQPSANDHEYCQFESAEKLSATGSNLKWYFSPTNNTNTSNALTPSTSNVGSTYFYVSQTVNECESDRAEIEIVVNQLPDAPTTTDLSYCQGESATPLVATGTSFRWYTQEFGGDGTSIAPIPTTSTGGTTTYYVSQIVSGCESFREGLEVIVTESESPLTDDADYCIGESAVELSATGDDLRWYTSAQGNNSSNTAPTPSTSTIGSTTYYVSQSINGCESDRAEIEVNVGGSTTTPITSDFTYCQNEDAMALIATGSNLLWYTSATAGNGVETLIPSTTTAGSKDYYVSQSVDGCESDRVALTVTVNEAPDAPMVTSQFSYVLDATAETLEASGTNLQWYTSANGTGTAIAPTPNTSLAGTTIYYVSQFSGGGCESEKSEISVTVSDALIVNKVTNGLVIDGNIDDIWTIVDGNVLSNVIQGSVSNTADLSGSFKLLWDNNNVYVLGEILDDSKINDSPQFYKDDAVEIFFDYGNHKNDEYNNDEVQYTFRWDDNQPTASNNNTAGIDFEMVETDGGYTFEASFPWSLLGGNGVKGQIHGFDFEINDDDDGGDRDGKISWNATEDEAWRNPTYFGEIILDEEITLCNKPSEAILEGSESICEGESSVLTANVVSGATYIWYNSGEVIIGESTNKLEVVETGVYHVRIADQFIDNMDCYANSERLFVTSYELPEPLIYGDESICLSDNDLYEYTVSSESGSTFEWSVSSNAMIISGEFDDLAEVEFSTGTEATIILTETNSNNCKANDTLEVVFDCVTSTYDMLESKTIFPNPFTDVIFVEDFTSYQILDLSGKVVSEGQIESGTIDTESLQQAIYMIKLISDEGIRIEKMSKE